MARRTRIPGSSMSRLAFVASITLASSLIGGAAGSAQSTGANITDASQPPVPMPPAYTWEQVAKGPKFKGATPAAMATDAFGNIVMVGAKWKQRTNGSVVPSPLAWHSSDGLTWTSVLVPEAAGEAIQSVIHADDSFIAADADGLLTSATGDEWTLTPGAGILGEGGHAVALSRARRPAWWLSASSPGRTPTAS